MAYAEFVKELGALLGHPPTELGSNRIAFEYVVPAGKFKDTKVTLGLEIPGDFPNTPPGGPHIKPRILPLNPSAPGHPERVASSAFGDEWEYWSRPYQDWAESGSFGPVIYGSPPFPARYSMNVSVAFPRQAHVEACAHLLRSDHQEDICFALWNPSRGANRLAALIWRLVLPEAGDRIVRGNASFLPSFFERAIRLARESQSGLALMHSHLGPGWQRMSDPDVLAEEGNAAAVKASTGLPLVGLTLGTDGAWSARFWSKVGPGKYQRDWCESVRVVGDWLDITRPPAEAGFRPRKSQERTIAAWGVTVQAGLARLRVGVVGAGSVGSAVGEALARVGVGEILLLDYDRVATANLDRTLHSYPEDVGYPKVEVLAHALRRSSTADAPKIIPAEWSIGEENGFRAALDCDVLFSCVDRPWPRSVLNFTALAHLIPVIDGGIAIERRADGAGILRAEWRAHTVTPTRRCMECLGQYDPGEVQADRDGLFEDPGYIRNLPPDHPVRHNENVFAFASSAASFEILQFLSLMVPMPGRRHPGAQTYHYVPAILDKELGGCKPTCYPHSLIALGDRTSLTLTGRDPIAEKHRSESRPRKNASGIARALRRIKKGKARHQPPVASE